MVGVLLVILSALLVIVAIILSALHALDFRVLHALFIADGFGGVWGNFAVGLLAGVISIAAEFALLSIDSAEFCFDELI